MNSHSLVFNHPPLLRARVGRGMRRIRDLTESSDSVVAGGGVNILNCENHTLGCINAAVWGFNPRHLVKLEESLGGRVN